MFEDLDVVFESSTIKPTFEKVHIILALIIFNENPEGIGRYRLKKELLIGSGMSRSLVTKLSDILNFIKINENNKWKGHILSQKGKQFLKRVWEKIPLTKSGNTEKLNSIVIDFENIDTYFCLVKSASDKVGSGIEQRDAAIKVNGYGATCLLFNGNNLVFPRSSEETIPVNEEVLNYFKQELKDADLRLEKEDTIILGSGDSKERARLAAFNAALTLL
ncbi:MAG: DUF4443 domain-containing protein [Promethearchaeota archaeon]|nr:MAG: DUF4443 domain-containing protein [Candidatus Lokiarchaeota archaeon]